MDRVPSATEKFSYLLNLLQRDGGVFLERYGELLAPAERAAFAPLRADYEVDFWLRRLEASPSNASYTPCKASKNRRLAQMARLEEEGEFFSDDAMRRRQPFVHYQMVGKFLTPAEKEAAATRAAAAPGATLSASIMRREEEREATARCEEERTAFEAAQEEEEEEEEVVEKIEGQGFTERASEEVEEGTEENAAPSTGTAHGIARASAVERAEQAAAFLDVMRQRFLHGKEAGVDYAAIDADASLDEHWAVEEARDVEDFYFGGDEEEDEEERKEKREHGGGEGDSQMGTSSEKGLKIPT
jgi:hypothetical protein